MSNFKALLIFIFLLISISSFAQDPFYQGNRFLSVTYSKLTESDDITLLARDRASPEVILEATDSYELNASLRIFSWLFVFAESAESTWKQGKSVGIDFDTGLEFTKKRNGTGVGVKLNRYTLKFGAFSVEDVLFYINAIGINKYEEFEATRFIFELSYLYKLNRSLGVNFGVMGWRTTDAKLPNTFKLEDKARIVNAGLSTSLGFLTIGINYKYGFKDTTTNVAEQKSIEKKYYNAYELNMTVAF